MAETETLNIENLPSHDATRRPQSRFSAGAVELGSVACADAGTLQGELFPKLAAQPQDDCVNRPAHYTQHPSGIECIQITEHMGFCLGNAIKYLWRADLKGNSIEDLKKAVWYIQREIERRQGGR